MRMNESVVEKERMRYSLSAKLPSISLIVMMSDYQWGSILSLEPYCIKNIDLCFQSFFSFLVLEISKIVLLCLCLFPVSYIIILTHPLDIFFHFKI